MLRFFATITLFLYCNMMTTLALAQSQQAEKVLQSLANIDQFQTTEGNQIKLIKTPQGCRIEAIFYGETGRTKENFLFAYIQNQPYLQHAARYDYRYSNGGLTNLSENKGNFSTTVQRVELDTKAFEQQQSFKTYLQLFPVTALQSCH